VSAELFTTAIGDFQPDEELKVQVIRDGRPQDITVRLAEQPEDPGDRTLTEGAELGRPILPFGISGRALRPNTIRGYEAEDRGVVVTDVDQDGPFAKAVKVGELITAVADHKIRNLAELQAALKAAGQKPQGAESAEPRQVRVDILQTDGDQRLEKITLP
jgi:S1-C subfamily serine protease